MEINNKIANYEINNNLHKSPTNATEKIVEKQSLEKPELNEEGQSKQDVVVELSQSSKEVQQIKEIISSAPDIREDKVAALKEKIESGEYKIDPDAIADKIVDDSLDEIF